MGRCTAKRRNAENDELQEAELLAAAGCDGVALLKKLLPAEGDLAAFDGPNGVALLMAAASMSHKAALKLLLEHGSNPSRRDAEGRSAAAYARSAGHAHLAARLDAVVDQEQTIW
jgi:ankyrin repeat protein